MESVDPNSDPWGTSDKEENSDCVVPEEGTHETRLRNL
jgi:hypothetical protein